MVISKNNKNPFRVPLGVLKAIGYYGFHRIQKESIQHLEK
jgi:hypothetical protein